MNRALKYIILVTAYGVVAYHLATYTGYSAIAACLRLWTTGEWLMLAAVVALMPLNQLLESLKWRSMVRHLEPVSIQQAVYATLIGQVGAIALPNRLADFPTRTLALRPGNRAAATIIGFLSGWALTIVIGIAGTIAGTIYIRHYTPVFFNTRYLTVAAAAVIMLMLFFIIFPGTLKFLEPLIPPKYKNLGFTARALSQLQAHQTITATLYSALRYTLFSFQYFVSLRTFGIQLSADEALTAIPTIYLLTTITPTVVLSEAAVRTSYAIAVLAPISASTPTIALATTLLWIINIGLPLVSGLVLFNLKKPAINFQNHHNRSVFNNKNSAPNNKNIKISNLSQLHR